MKPISTLLLAGSWFFATAEPLSRNSDLLVRNTEYTVPGALSALETSNLVSRAGGDDGVIANLAKQGKCFAYVKGNNPEKSKRGCKTFCDKKGANTGYGCAAKLPLDFEPTNVNSIEDEDGNRYVPGKCCCECEVYDYMVDLVEGLAELDEVLCAAVLSSSTTIAEVGLQFVSGGASASAALRNAVAGARGFAENGLGAASFFGNWVGRACGKPDFNFDLMSIFNPLVNAPDSIAKSPGCKRRNHAACKRIDPMPGPPKKADPPKPPKKST